MNKYRIGIDIGTTSAKTIVFGEDFTVCGRAGRDIETLSPELGLKEQRPLEILDAVVDTLKRAIQESAVPASDIDFISLSAAMHSLIVVDAGGNPLTNCIIWADNRASDIVDRYKESGEGQKFYERSGTPCHPMAPVYKVLWMKENRPELFAPGTRFIGLKDFVLFHLFGAFVADESLASATGLFNIHKRVWDPEILKAVGLSEEMLSRTVPTTHVITGMRAEMCTRTGLLPTTRCVVGASDGCLAHIGSKALKPGDLSATIGTSGAVRIMTQQPVIDPEGKVFCYVLDDVHYIAGGAINSGGIVQQWFSEQFQNAPPPADAPSAAPVVAPAAASKAHADFSRMRDSLRRTPAGADGLLFLPFLTGERAPYWDARLRGSFLGITDHHTRDAFGRAVIEGICYALCDVFATLQEHVPTSGRMLANGGFSQSPEWVQILADVTGQDIVVHENHDSPCLGAIILGLRATGRIRDIKEAVGIDQRETLFRPNPSTHERYELLFGIYRDAIRALRPVYARLSKFQTRVQLAT